MLLVIFGLAARNLAQSRIGRAFTAIRDRDIAAGVIGVNLAKYKTIVRASAPTGWLGGTLGKDGAARFRSGWFCAEQGQLINGRRKINRWPAGFG